MEKVRSKDYPSRQHSLKKHLLDEPVTAKGRYPLIFMRNDSGDAAAQTASAFPDSRYAVFFAPVALMASVLARASHWQRGCVAVGLVLLSMMALIASPNAVAQTPTYNANCSGCHGLDGGRVNAAGSVAVISAANVNHGMGIGGLSGATLATIAAELNTFFAAQLTQAVNVNYLSANNAIPITGLVIDNPGAVVTTTSLVSGATNGTVGVGTANSVTVTYSHTAANSCSDSFQVAGTGGGATTTGRTVNVTVNPPALTATNSSPSIAYNSGAFTNVPLVTSGPFSGVTITTGLSPNVGTLQVVGTNVQYQASSSAYSGAVTFSYRTTGPCVSQSTIATVTLNVGLPPAPGSSNNATNAAFNTPQAVVLPVTGIFTQVNVTGATNGAAPTPALGATTVTFTPTNNFIGAGSITYTVTGPGGTSAPFTATVNVITPGPPTVSNVAVNNVAFQTATPVPLTIGGVFNQLNIVSGPANGTAPTPAVNTSTVTYTPNALFIGTDSITYNATGPGGPSTNATISITVLAPAAPGVSAVAQNVNFQTATPITLPVTGPFTQVTVITGPANGTAPTPGANSNAVTYTPNSGFIGADSFTYRATAPGGAQSAPATVSITVAAPGAPTVSARSVTTAFNVPTVINLAPNITGPVASVAVVAGSVTNGTATAVGTSVTFTPTTGYTGPATFQYTATAPGGAVSAPATVSVTVATQAPVASAAAMTVQLNATGTLDLAPFITGSAITGVQIAAAPGKGTATVSGTKVLYTPVTDFFGTDTFTYQAIGNAGTSAPARITVTIVGRPDPTKNANTVGLLSAQTATARRFAQGQTTNFQRRLEDRRRRATGGAERSGSDSSAASAVARGVEPSGVGSVVNAERASPSAANPVSNGDSRALEPRAGNAERLLVSPSAVSAVRPVQLAALDIGGKASDVMGEGLSLPGFAGELMSIAKNRAINVAQLAGSSGGADAPVFGVNGLSYWMDGTVSFGSRDATGVRGATDFTTSGVSAGVDYRITEKLVLGVGVGYARDRTNIGTDGTSNRSQGYSVAVYGSYQPTQNTFVDGLLGAGSMRFDSDRFVPAVTDFARANRSGAQLFGALIGGYELRRNGMLWSPYGRIDFSVDRLNQATESGAGLNALTYFAQRQKSLQSALGLRVESAHEVEFGWVSPRLRGEYRHDAQREQQASISYADQVGTGPRYTLGTGPLERSTYVLGLGNDFILRNGLTLGVDYQLNYSSAQSRSQTVRVKLQIDLDGKPRRPSFMGADSDMGSLDLQFDGGYTFDDNVNRASDRRERLADQSFSANVTNNWLFPLSDKVRALTTATLGGEKFKNYEGLGRASAGVTGDLQYRASADYTARTFSLFGKSFIERYDSDSRDNYRYTVGASVLQTLTDRITAFVAVSHDARFAKSAVFDSKFNSRRMNIDYALHKDGALYLGAEYRRGDSVSTAMPTLANLDIAKAFRADDVFGKGLTSYRVDSRTLIGTLGYNLGFGPRNALDISWRHILSTPLQSPSFAAPGFRYVVNQYHLVYLMRF